MIVLNNIALFNGHADHFCGDASVVFADGRILYAGPRDGSPALDGDSQVIDGQGHFVMPGMVESHAHLSYTNHNLYSARSGQCPVVSPRARVSGTSGAKDPL